MATMSASPLIDARTHVDVRSAETTGRQIGDEVVRRLRSAPAVVVKLDGLPLGFARSSMFNVLLDTVVAGGHSVADAAHAIEWRASESVLVEIAKYCVEVWLLARSKTSRVAPK